ncbi:CotS family spore coat protein [Clostridium bovifaecis]|uniref:CotS family spore coat protein n=1 Tax=Clostridium bovifaecis TaxID=2184719 RepID=A0A6I6ERY8_9CLOT|nr:CotS family spore coat protein [Clostridium bovifaecis]
MKEGELVTRVLDKYGFKVLSYGKIRSVYKVKTNKGTICLKKFKHGKYKASNGSFLVQELYKNDFFNTPNYICTKNKNLFVKYKSLFFYVTEWVDGIECDLSEINETKNCAKLLARFHLATHKIDCEKLKIRNNLRNWPEVYKNKLYDFNKYEKIIASKMIKNTFDIVYRDNIQKFYNIGLITLTILNNSKYYKLSEIANKEHTICHDSFYYQNIIKKEDRYYIIDLDSIIIDLQVNDLGKFIRRLMYKSSYKWEFKKAEEIIESYNTVNKLSKDELEVMLALIMFPHKFWKLGKKRYFDFKNWNEKKYVHKLNKIIKYGELQQKFLEDYIQYLDRYDKNFSKEG